MGWRRSAVAARSVGCRTGGGAGFAFARAGAVDRLRRAGRTSQRNGALLVASQLKDVMLKPDVLDTQATPEAAVTAWERVMGGATSPAVVGPILGTQMLALLPLAEERGVPLLTISGTARLGELGNPWFFRFFPSDATVKVAHARYVVEKLSAKRPAVIYQSTAYGQSGREQLNKT